ncbi:MAG: GntR family transcriptional regulator [Betaproteobacteria bacterium]|nr:GntR family transcriptional regulator [Betaproteobacteria bacterium]
MIVTLQLLPGSTVSETDLAQRLGIGRTPIREALHRLAREHLITILPRRGIIVSEISVQGQLRLLEVRRELERLVAKSAARRATPEERERFLALAQQFEEGAKIDDEVSYMRVDREFHELIVRAARNEFAVGVMTMMHSLSRRFGYIHYKQAADMPLTAKLHADVARMIAAGDELEAGNTMDKLLASVTQFTRDTVTKDF